jgi:hypothetical protein
VTGLDPKPMPLKAFDTKKPKNVFSYTIFRLSRRYDTTALNQILKGKAVTVVKIVHSSIELH